MGSRGCCARAPRNSPTASGRLHAAFESVTGPPSSPWPTTSPNACGPCPRPPRAGRRPTSCSPLCRAARSPRPAWAARLCVRTRYPSSRPAARSSSRALRPVGKPRRASTRRDREQRAIRALSLRADASPAIAKTGHSPAGDHRAATCRPSLDAVLRYSRAPGNRRLPDCPSAVPRGDGQAMTVAGTRVRQGACPCQRRCAVSGSLTGTRTLSRDGCTRPQTAPLSVKGPGPAPLRVRRSSPVSSGGACLTPAAGRRGGRTAGSGGRRARDRGRDASGVGLGGPGK